MFEKKVGYVVVRLISQLYFIIIVNIGLIGLPYYYIDIALNNDSSSSTDFGLA